MHPAAAPPKRALTCLTWPDGRGAAPLPESGATLEVLAAVPSGFLRGSSGHTGGFQEAQGEQGPGPAPEPHSTKDVARTSLELGRWGT